MRVLMLIKTTGLDYDDRVRKEALSLYALGYDVRISALEYLNQSGNRKVYEKIFASTISLKSRQWLQRKNGLLVKTIEMYTRFVFSVLKQKPDVIWVHNLELGGLVLLFALSRKFGFPKQLIWDQHELPSDRLLKNRLFSRLFAMLINGCDKIIMANTHRRDLIKDILGNHLSVTIEVLNNYPDELFVNLPKVDLPSDVQKWLDGSDYVLAQGGANPNRHLVELVEAIMGLPNIKLIVVGPYQNDQLEYLKRRFGAIVTDRVYFTGFVPQMQLVPYIDHAKASVVLYSMSIQNSRLCAPNRLYQAVARGVPVIVGVNPPMAEFVNECRCGVVLSSDGGDVDDIQSGIKSLLANWDFFRRNAQTHQNDVRWESQQPVVERILPSANTL